MDQDRPSKNHDDTEEVKKKSIFITTGGLFQTTYFFARNVIAPFILLDRSTDKQRREEREGDHDICSKEKELARRYLLAVWARLSVLYDPPRTRLSLHLNFSLTLR